jgi:hypothetical protein
VVPRVQPPGLALGRPEQPAATPDHGPAGGAGIRPTRTRRRPRCRPDPRGRRRGPCARARREREEELGLVPAEAYWRLIAPYLIFGGPGGSCVRICPQICPRGRIWEVLCGAHSPGLQGLR